MNFLETDLQDSVTELPEFVTKQARPTTEPLAYAQPEEPPTEIIPELGDEDDGMTVAEIERLRPIYLGETMERYRGTSSSAVMTKWHRLSAHINMRYLRQVAPGIEGMEEITRIPASEKLPVCDSCLRGKSRHKPLPKRTYKRSTEPMHRIHIDASGIIKVPTMDGAHYFLLFLDDATGYKFVALLRTKDEYLDALNALIIQLGFAPKVIRIDNAGEMNSARAYEFYEAMRIWVEVCNAYEHHQSGRVESAIGSISMRLRVMLSGVKRTAADVLGVRLPVCCGD